jgi:ATP-dependent Lon protease
LIPKDNEKDLADIPDSILKELEVVPVTSIDDVLDHAFVTRPVPIEWPEDEDEDEIKVSETKDSESIVTH